VLGDNHGTPVVGNRAVEANDAISEGHDLGSGGRAEVLCDVVAPGARRVSRAEVSKVKAPVIVVVAGHRELALTLVSAAEHGVGVRVNIHVIIGSDVNA
jgi:hypothetical protein